MNRSMPGLPVHHQLPEFTQWCHPAISSSIFPFSSCAQSLPASESFPMSQLFTWGGQSTGASALASFLPKNTQGWFPLERTDWISLQSKGLSRVKYLYTFVFSTFWKQCYWDIIHTLFNHPLKTCNSQIHVYVWLNHFCCTPETSNIVNQL